MNSPILMVFAGPNGSGKSTVTRQYPVIGEIVNPDQIKAECGCSDIEAAIIAENTREYLLSIGKSFTFESVLSIKDKYDFLRRAKEAGYRVICIFILTKSPDINVQRVKYRVEHGGHDVPEEKIRERYKRALKLFPELFGICDELYVYDNSPDRSEGEPSLIIKHVCEKTYLLPNNVWSSEMLCNLCSGNYRA